ncbi:hypothetical protein GGR44_001131 [Sphingobium fontiphilum]|uniref:Peptidase S74 domain-containing protein n=1 Tax=Sphingobium fontiphilum TaxID=944425 RepID=A0A7W6GPX7_9SPHN|nr:tail fiber domain-containing protein [Sphingobium fontiphilum]MBB3981484.1 hypothetical protein [Sphingobium fontiphilum]
MEPIIFADLVLEVCHAGGAGPLALGGAVAGYRRFADAVEAEARFPYAIFGVASPGEWETGIGWLDGEGLLAREPVASSADGAAVDFSVGEKHVALTPTADWLAQIVGHGHGVGDVDGLDAALAAGVAATDALASDVAALGAAQAGQQDSIDALAGGLAVQADAIAAVEAGLAGKQAASADLSAIAAAGTAAFGRGVLTQGDAAAARAYIGAGTSSAAGTVTSVDGSGGTTGLTLTGGPVSVSGTLTLGGTLALAHGGTGASDAAGARAALGLGSAATHASGDYLASTGGTVTGVVTVDTTSATGAAQVNAMANNFAQCTVISYRSSIATHCNFVGQAAYGTLAAPEQIGAANVSLFELSSRPWTGSAFGQQARIVFSSTSAHSPTNLGIYASIDLTADGSTTRTQVARFDAGTGVTVTGIVRPDADNSRTLGEAARRWSVVYAGTGTINTSDARDKVDVGAPDEALLDAWGGAAWRRYRFADAVAAKGADARWHMGMVAQETRDVIDGVLGAGAAVRWGLVCHDAWDAEDEARDADGALVRPGRAAGDRWGLRYDECLALEAMWLRREIARLTARVTALEMAHAAE